MRGLLFLLLLISGSVSAQGYIIQADSTKLRKQGGNNELIIHNSTRTLNGGYLKNVIGGKTGFAYAIDSAAISGSNLVFYRGGGTQNITLPVGVGTGWNLTGNSGTTAGTNFIGTTDAVAFVIKTNGTERLRVLSGGNIGIGTATPSNALTVDAGTGGFRYVDTNEGAGKVLTSQADGTAEWTSEPSGLSLPINKIIAATGSSTITNGDTNIDWGWNLSSGTGLIIRNNGANADANSQTSFQVINQGANTNPGQTTYGARISNSHSGTSSTNVGLSLTATGGTNNYALIVPSGSGRVGIGTSTPTRLLEIVDNTAGQTSVTINNSSATGQGLSVTTGATAVSNAVFVAATTGAGTFFTLGGDATVRPVLANNTSQDRLVGQVNTANTLGYVTIGSGLSLLSGELSSTVTSTSPAGNFGNLQIGRNGAFATPGSDSLDFESASGLTVLGDVNVGNGINIMGAIQSNPGVANLSVSISGGNTFLMQGLNGGGGLIDGIIDGNTLSLRQPVAGVTAVYMSSAGNIGINQTSPTTRLQVAGRFAVQQGADVASAANITLGTDGNTFEITGTTDIDLISNIGWINGSVIYLHFNDAVRINDNVATSGTDITILLDGASNWVSTAGSTLTLQLSENGGVQAWRQIARMTR